MKVGITFGAYCPLHQGHLDVIMRAKKENDMCFVIVCGYDNDRGKDILPMIKRYRIIANFLKDETVVVEKIDDTALGLDESMSSANWIAWRQAAYRLIENKIGTGNEYTWYVSEQQYVEPLSKEDKVIFMDRTQNPISGTLCRTDPLKHWDKITQPFRAYYSHNILIAGTASEGKTTLTCDIGKYFNLPYSYEKGRDICGMKTDPEFTVKDFIYNLYEQNKYNEQLICSAGNPGFFVSDTDNCVTLMYAWFYAQREGFGITMEDYELLHNVAKTYAKTIKWNKIFLLKPSTKGIVDDGERYMPDSDYKIRVAFYEKLKELYDEFGYEYEELEGDYYQRFCTVKEYINNVKD